MNSNLVRQYMAQLQATDNNNQDRVISTLSPTGNNPPQESNLELQKASNSEPQKIKRKRLPTSKPPNRMVQRPSTRFSDIGGMDKTITYLRQLIERPLLFPHIFQHLRIDPPRGILLCGPSGCGKTTIANAVAGHYGFPFIRMSSTELVSNLSGDTESNIRDVFEQAKASAPSIIFIDDIDAIITKKENAQREMEKRIITQLIACMDDLSLYPVSGKNVLILAATSRPESLDSSLRRAGRFDHEIKINIPSEAQRTEIFDVLTRKLQLSQDVNRFFIARNTPGYVGADFKMLISEAALNAVNRICDNMGLNSYRLEDFHEGHVMADHICPLPVELDIVYISMEDFLLGLRKVQPAAKREGFAVVPDISWDDIGALSSIRQELRMAVVEPMCHPDLFKKLGVETPAGVLLWGPPGCGKTLLAKAVANESHSNFISVKGPELLNKYVGESEKAVRQVFERARLSAPCVIFFDELDALCPRRNDDTSGYASRVVNQLLTEMDGLEGRQSVYIIAASNRPDIIDPAILRPGRLDKLIYVNLPNANERHDILIQQTRKTPLALDVDLKILAEHSRCEGFSGADIGSLVREASLAAAKEYIMNKTVLPRPEPQVTQQHFTIALSSMFPSVSVQDRANYDKLFLEFTLNRLK